MKTTKRCARKRAPPNGYICFTLGGTFHARRVSYSNERREQVHEVRKVGACLRCHLLKKSCSRGNPCTTCVRAAENKIASCSLAWMDCVRPSLMNVTIYGLEARFDPDIGLGGVPVLQYLTHGDLDLKFDIPFQWNIDELSTFVAGWLVRDHDASRASMAGLLSSASLLSIISDLIGSEIAQVFKWLVSTSSMIFNTCSGNVVYSQNSTDIRILRHCGYRLLLHLESHIKPMTLARLRKHELYAMFLLLLGCIISSKYVAESLGDLSRLPLAVDQSTAVQHAQPSSITHSDEERGTELIRLLAHHMVYLGQSTGLLQDRVSKTLIAYLTSTPWQKKLVPPTNQVEVDLWPPNHSSRYLFSPAETKSPLVEDSISANDPDSSICHKGLKRTLRDLPSIGRNKHLENALCEVASCSRCHIAESSLDYLEERQYHNRSWFLCKSCSRSIYLRGDLASRGGGGTGSTVGQSFAHSSNFVTTAFEKPSYANLNSRKPTTSGSNNTAAEVSKDLPTLFNFNQPLNNNLGPPSPLDFNVACFDPSLPTNDIDTTLVLQLDNTEQWPCLRRIPTPQPEQDLELERHM
ncbi:hypothetical protein, variant [Verruconis gallopava]|uniref:Zn(2)-C6 fungal-type domain-containing protein n=1 Tax=Verruconis gallopava TaxID=253628 RepID=A0A0D1X927_9PEZI|nr:hypothetical protein, variant [Verruconis gallopava]KIV98565.1 hypothetical protein, variant [Verruconis gallopava]